MKGYLEKWCYQVIMAGGGDYWALHGLCNGEPIAVSVPRKLEKIDDHFVVTTYSGSKYMLRPADCNGNLEKQLSYIKEDVKRELA